MTVAYDMDPISVEFDGYNRAVGTATMDLLAPLAYPPPGAVGAQYENVVWDTVAAAYVTWRTYYVDNGGQYYPGPGTFGANTSDFAVETIHYDRNQL